MKLQAVHGFCIGGGIDVQPGEVFESSSPSLTAQWLNSGAAVVAAEAPPVPDRTDVPVPIIMDAGNDASGNAVSTATTPIVQPSGRKKEKL